MSDDRFSNLFRDDPENPSADRGPNSDGQDTVEYRPFPEGTDDWASQTRPRPGATAERSGDGEAETAFGERLPVGAAVASTDPAEGDSAAGAAEETKKDDTGETKTKKGRKGKDKSKSDGSGEDKPKKKKRKVLLWSILGGSVVIIAGVAVAVSYAQGWIWGDSPLGPVETSSTAVDDPDDSDDVDPDDPTATGTGPKSTGKSTPKKRTITFTPKVPTPTQPTFRPTTARPTTPTPTATRTFTSPPPTTTAPTAAPAKITSIDVGPQGTLYPVITGTAGAGDQVSLQIGNMLVQMVADPNGNWTAAPPYAAIGSGNLAVTAKARRNPTPDTTSLSLAAAPNMTLAAPEGTIKYTLNGVPGASIALIIDGDARSVTLDGSGFAAGAVEIASGDHTVTAIYSASGRTGHQTPATGIEVP